MNQKIKVLLIDTCGWITSICIIFFFFTLWLYSYNEIESPLKEAWSLTISMLSALATIGAAIIAAMLFNDWRESQTGINRSELAKNTQTSLYKLVSYLNFYQKYVVNQKGLLNAMNFPDVSQSFIDQAKKIPKECEDNRSKFREESDELYKQFQIDLMIYENTFKTDLKMEFGYFIDYRASIGGMLRDLAQSKSNKELDKMTGQMMKCKKKFNEEVLKPVTEEMSKYINIKVN